MRTDGVVRDVNNRPTLTGVALSAVSV